MERLHSAEGSRPSRRTTFNYNSPLSSNLGVTERCKRLETFENTAAKEVEMTWEALEKERTHELSELRLDDDRMDVIKQQQMELLLQAAREREETRDQIMMEKKELERRERQHEETCQLLASCSSPDITAADLHALLCQEREALDTQRKLFEDLEFNLLELETRHEEEREPIQQKLSTEHTHLMQSRAQHQKKLKLIKQRKEDLMVHLRADVREFEKERTVLNQLIAQQDFDGERSENIRLASSRPRRLLQHLTGVETEPSSVCSTKVSMKKNMDYSHERASGVGNAAQTKRSHSFCVKPTKPADKRLIANGFAKAASTDSAHGALNDSLDSNLSFSSDTNFEEEQQFPPMTLSDGVSANGKSRRGADNTVQRSASTSRNCDDRELKLRDNRHTVQQSRPMTCYLPVRETDAQLNLRHFVELSGHVVDDRVQVAVDSTTCRGILTKMGGRFRTWHKRWFVFDRCAHSLTYYVDRTERKPRQTIHFRSIQDVFVDHLRMVKSPQPAWTFCIKTSDRRYFLVAPGAEAMRIWIDVIFSGAEGYREFE